MQRLGIPDDSRKARYGVSVDCLTVPYHVGYVVETTSMIIDYSKPCTRCGRPHLSAVDQILVKSLLKDAAGTLQMLVAKAYPHGDQVSQNNEYDQSEQD